MTDLCGNLRASLGTNLRDNLRAVIMGETGGTALDGIEQSLNGG